MSNTIFPYVALAARETAQARTWLASAMLAVGACLPLVPVAADEIRPERSPTPLATACLAWRERIEFLTEMRERTGSLDAEEGLVIRDGAATLAERCAHRDPRPVLRQFALLLDLLEDEEDHR